MITFIKFLTWLASPIGILTACCIVAGTLLLIRKAPRTRLLLIALGAGQILFFASPWVATALNQYLDKKAQELQVQNQGGPYAAILVLGGMIDYNPLSRTVNLGHSVDRLWYAAELYQRGLSHKLIVSGGNEVADRFPDAPTQSELMKNALMTLGVPADAIILEPQALTTHEHMPYVHQLMEAHSLKGRLAMVTSASHMPRAMRNAQQNRLLVDAYPTDWYIPYHARTWLDQCLPKARYLLASDLAIRELLGQLTGY